LPYEKEFNKKVDSNVSIFVKGFHKQWTHKILYDHFKEFGEIVSSKISIDQNHDARGYGFVQFEKEESVHKAIQKVN
jgi:polyadenylate-binding protein